MDQIKDRAAPSRRNCGPRYHRLADMRIVPVGSVSLEYTRDEFHRLKYVGLVATVNDDDDRFVDYVVRSGQQFGVMRLSELMDEMTKAGVLPTVWPCEHGPDCIYLDKPYELSEIRRKTAKNLARLPLSFENRRLANIAAMLVESDRGNWVYIGDSRWRDIDGVESTIL